jgi:hypothetical protein
MKTPDPTEEIKTVRHQLGAELDFDLHRIIEATLQRQRTSGRTYVRLSKRVPEPSEFRNPSSQDYSAPDHVAEP